MNAELEQIGKNAAKAKYGAALLTTEQKNQALLKVAGYLAIHTRQLDMIMQDKDQCARKRAEILEHCRILYTGLK